MEHIIKQILIIILCISFNVYSSDRYQNWGSDKISDTVFTMADYINRYYVFPETGKQMSDAMLSALGQGIYDSLDPDELADELTLLMRTISNDLHMVTIAKYQVPGKQYNSYDSTQSKDVTALLDRQFNYGFSKVEILDGNIGYIKLDAFAELDSAISYIDAVMLFIANSDALIMDLRQNDGGSPKTVSYLLSYFFENKTVLSEQHWRDKNKVIALSTQATVPSPKFLNKPLILLTSNNTRSAAEDFAYTLKHNDLAKIVGKVTSGGAHFADVYDINDEFLLQIAIGQTINLKTNSNWQNVGVKPNIQIDSEHSLPLAITELLTTLKKSNKDKDMSIYYADLLQRMKTIKPENK